MRKKNMAFFLAAIFLWFSLFCPYLFVIFSSPQYPERSPKLYLYLDGLKGDLKDWEVLGRYIGVNVHPWLPEFKYKTMVFIVAGLGLFTLFCANKKIKWKRLISLIILVLGLGSAGWAQFRLYQQGHRLDPQAPLRYTVKPFTPPPNWPHPGA